MFKNLTDEDIKLLVRSLDSNAPDWLVNELLCEVIKRLEERNGPR